ncbi:MAG: hypothetical protein KAX49_14105 [Halanaerobiales bacterium]|nr:hypothetical protein [Halanaerobiales bacterium]
MITKEEFIKYEKVRMSGVTNMMDVEIVSSLTSLDEEKIIEIINDYKSLSKQYPNVRNNSFPL